MWYKFAAEQKHVLGSYNAGQILVLGFGVDVNYKKAFKYLKFAADSGFKEAVNALNRYFPKLK